MTLKEFLKGKNRKEFAQALEMSPGYLAQIATRDRYPGRELAARISAATKGAVTIEELLYPNGLPTDAEQAKLCAS
jgi:DNA-binding transcriptional regulator YdaS (Cro superfamily)